MGALSQKTASLFGNKVWIMGCTWLPNPSTYSLVVIRPWGQQDTVPRYCCPNHHGTSSVFHCWNQAFRIVGFFGCSPNVNSSLCRDQHEGRLIRLYHAFPFVSCTGFMVVTPSSTHLSITLSSPRFGNCSPTVDVEFVKLTSDSFCQNRVFKMISSAVLSPVLQ
jgi:hypothetical protein